MKRQLFFIGLILSVFLFQFPLWAGPENVLCPIEQSDYKDFYQELNLVDQFEGSTPLKKNALLSRYPDLTDLMVTIYEHSDLRELITRAKKIYKLPKGSTPSLGQVMQVGLDHMQIGIQKMRAMIKDLHLSRAERINFETALNQLDHHAQNPNLKLKIEAAMGTPLNLSSNEQREALFLIGRKNQTAIGELRAAMVVRDLDMIGPRVDQVYDRLKILAGEFKQKGYDAKRWQTKVEQAYRQLPHNLQHKEIDLTTLPTTRGILLGEVKTFEHPLTKGSSSWDDLVSQLEKQEIIATSISSLGIPVQKTVYLINGVTPEAKAKLMQKFGVEVIGQVIPSGSWRQVIKEWPPFSLEFCSLQRMMQAFYENHFYVYS